MARGSVQRRFLQRLRGSALALDYNHGVAETSPLRESDLVVILVVDSAGSLLDATGASAG